jgi:hypothetical protein
MSWNRYLQDTCHARFQTYERGLSHCLQSSCLYIGFVFYDQVDDALLINNKNFVDGGVNQPSWRLSLLALVFSWFALTTSNLEVGVSSPAPFSRNFFEPLVI